MEGAMKLYSSCVVKMPIPTPSTSAAHPKDSIKFVEGKAQPTHFPLKKAVVRTSLVPSGSSEDSEEREIKLPRRSATLKYAFTEFCNTVTEQKS